MATFDPFLVFFDFLQDFRYFVAKWGTFFTFDVARRLKLPFFCNPPVSAIPGGAFLVILDHFEGIYTNSPESAQKNPKNYPLTGKILG